MIKKKLTALGSYFFIFGAIIALFDLAFETPTHLQGTKLFILLITSIGVGIINIASEQKYKFMVSALAFSLFMYLFTDILQQYLIAINSTFPWENLMMMFTDMVLLVLPAGVIVALTEIVEIMSIAKNDEHHYRHLHEPMKKNFQKIWDQVVILAVAVALIVFVLPLTFDVAKYENILIILDSIVLIIFVFDIFILFRRAKTFKEFIKHYWIDIIAILPFNAIFKTAKLFRVSRVIKIAAKSSELSKAAHASKLIKANKTMKYFSAEKKFHKKE